jgi:uncharacterized protein
MPMQNFVRIVLVAFATALLLAAPASAEELTAEQIVEKSTANRSAKNSIQTMTMKIYDKSGRSRSRTITSKLKEGEDGRTRSYVRFEAPDDVVGVQFLAIQNPGGEDDQWLYMPAGGILNRITGGGKKGYFMGSDFTFEDLGVGASTDEGTHTLLGEETITVGGVTIEAYKVETVPKPELESGYSKLVTWIDKAEFMPRQVEFYDAKKGELTKRMLIEEVRKDGDLLVPIRTVMDNLKRSTKTEIIVEDYRIDVPVEELPDSMFTPEYLQTEG